MRAKTVTLREIHRAPPSSGQVIDADFAVVRRKRGWLEKALLALFVIALTALAGMMVPPVWVLTRALLGES